jgi:membrane protein implicated in regulation of membrane protease activity
MHYLLLLPLLGIAVFFVGLPLGIATTIYIFILIVSGLMYWVIYRAMKKKPASGVEALVGTEARVVSSLEANEDAQYLVKIRGETWKAKSNELLVQGDTVKIMSLDGLILFVKKAK